MRTLEELLAAWEEGPVLPRGRGTVAALGLRLPDEGREAPSEVTVTVERGVVGDRWEHGRRPSTDRQVTLMSARAAELVADGGPWELAGDNLYVDLDLSESALPAGTRLRCGEALLEVTAEPHLGCKKFRRRFGEDALTWVNHPDRRHLRLRGVHCRVVAGGRIAVGDVCEVETG